MQKNTSAPKELLSLIRKLIDLSYRHSGNKELFYRKFTEVIHIDELKRLHIIEPGAIESKHKNIDKLNPQEREMYSLMCSGFSAQEINVICKHKSINLTYVKKYRIRKKLKGAVSSEILLIMLIITIFLYLLITILTHTGLICL